MRKQLLMSVILNVALVAGVAVNAAVGYRTEQRLDRVAETARQPGPAGTPGPQGIPGPAGPAGRSGLDGLDGVDGRDGGTCPYGYMPQRLRVVTGVRYAIYGRDLHHADSRALDVDTAWITVCPG